MIKSLPTLSKPVEEQEDLEEGEVYSTPSKNLGESFSETANSVLNKINPFENQPSAAPKRPTQKEKQSAFERTFSKIEKKLGLTENEHGRDQERVEDFLEAHSNNYANNNDGDMLNNTPPEDENVSLLSPSGSVKQKKIKPIGSIEYEVQNNDTIEKISLKWNTVPSEIKRLNRFSTRVLFPGQIVYVPDPDYVPPSPTTPVKSLEKSKSSSVESKEDDLTSKSQNQSTPLSSFNIFKWKPSNSAKPGHAEQQKVFHERRESLGHHPLNDNRHVISEDEAKQLDQECMQRFLKINCRIVTRSKGCHDGVIIITPSAIMFDPHNASEASSPALVKEDTPQGPHSTIYDESSAIIPIELISNVIMYEDLHLKDVEEYFEYQQHIALLEYDIISHNSSDRKSDVTFQIDPDDSINQKQSDSSMIIDSKDKEEFDANVSDFLKEDKNNSKDSSHIEQKIEKFSKPTCYVCFQVNNNKNVINCPMDRKMKNKLKSEFWFQIYDDCFKNTDKICAFFLEWRPDNEYSLTPEQKATRRFQLLKEDERLADLIADNLTLGNASFANKSSKFNNSTNRLINKEFFIKDWEIVNLHELESKLKLEMEIEKEYNTLPILSSKSDILKDDHLRKLNVNLIPRAMGYTWLRSFSTDEQGFSLKHLYRQLSEVETPCLIIVQDTCRNIFGVMTDSKLYPSEHYYGTGECFLFSFYPSFKVYKWTGENNFFMRGNTESIGFGCGEGYHGLWFDGDLLNGHSQKSRTFDNEPLTSSEYFTIASLEVWTFAEESD